ncbi:hypothetical protein CDAR_11631 [Caerostris darwini]|uniref:Uncharacterized protein n=1 Tax=Caerostris darwini TaxID=1538125 RepID=A0AAV4RE89_9ARAC|nr:hypothetical protein CDAR_11631 [Caerostris darwini]
MNGNVENLRSLGKIQRIGSEKIHKILTNCFSKVESIHSTNQYQFSATNAINKESFRNGGEAISDVTSHPKLKNTTSTLRKANTFRSAATQHTRPLMPPHVPKLSSRHLLGRDLSSFAVCCPGERSRAGVNAGGRGLWERWATPSSKSTNLV